MIPLMLLIVLGSLGFLVWQELLKHGVHLKRYSLHAKIVLSTTGILLVGGALLFLLFERNGVLTGMNPGEAIQQAFFLSVTPRTAGFASVSYGDISGASWLLTIFLMIVGGAPGSTAGGVKITTFAVLVLDAVASARQSNQVTVFKRRLDDKVVRQANAICIIYAGIVFGGSAILSAVQELPIRSVLLEVVSAASTVGLSTGITSALAPVSKLLITLIMYSGRIGCMTLALLVSEKRTPPPINRPTEKILVG